MCDLNSSERVSIPLFEDLIPGGIKPGTMFLVEFDPASQWLAIAATISARFLMAGGRVCYSATNRQPEGVKTSLEALGVDVNEAFRQQRLLIDDLYSAGLSGGRLASSEGKYGWAEPIEGGLRFLSLRVVDLSVEWLRNLKGSFQPWDVVETWPAGALGFVESISEGLRFNEENAYVEFHISRTWPNDRRAKRIVFVGVALGIHAESFYKRMENAADGIIEVRVLERDGEIRDFLRVKNVKGQPHDARWHEIEIKQNGEAALRS